MRARLLPLALAAVFAGCGGPGGGGGDFEGAEADVAEAIEELRTSGTRQESAPEICRNLLTTRLQQRLTADGSTCAQEIRQAIADADLFDMRPTDIEVTGDRAVAQVVSQAGDTRAEATLQLARERGDWRLDEIRGAS